MKRILIIEDDISIGEVERDYLETSGFEVTVINDGHKGYEEALANDYDLLILDLMLSSMDGLNLSKELRKHKTMPIIMMTSVSEDIERIRGLGLDINDYLSKPFSPNELVARVKAHVSRYEPLKGNLDDSKDIIRVRNITINVQLQQVFVNDNLIDLSEKEYDLLFLLISTPNKVFNKDEILKEIWGLTSIKDISVVTSHIRELREKIEFNPSKPEHLQTIWGLGYKFKK